MTLAQLQSFVLVARLGSVKAAAAQLGVTAAEHDRVEIEPVLVDQAQRGRRSRESRAAVLRDEAAPCRTVVPLKVCYFQRRQNRHQILPVPARAPAVMDQRAGRTASSVPHRQVCEDVGVSFGAPAPGGAEAVVDLGRVSQSWTTRGCLAHLG